MKTCLIVVVVVCLVLGGGLLLLVHINNEYQHQSARDRIAYARSDGTLIFVADHIAREEFLKLIPDIRPDEHLEVSVEYQQDADDFLRQIAGLHGIQKLRLSKSDVTDDGMRYVATLPDLEELTLYHVRASSAGFNNLAPSPRLTTIYLYPRGSDETTIPALLALPHLEKLYLDSDKWLHFGLEQLSQAHNLRELELGGPLFTPRDLAALQAHLPNCKIVQHNRR